MSPDLRRLLVGNAVSTLGNAVYLVAVLLFLKEISQSAFTLGLFQFLALAPGFFLSPVTGTIIDRVSRRTVLVWADAIRGVIMVVAGAALMTGAVSPITVVLAGAVIAGVGHAFFVPAAQALIPSLAAGQLERANALRAASAQGANLAGNALGGVLFVVLGAPLIYILNGVTFVLSALAERRIARDVVAGADGAAQEGRHEPFLSAMRRAPQLVAGSPRLARLMISQAALFVVSPLFVLSVPFLVIDDLGAPSWVVGALFALSLGGGIAAFALLTRLGTDRMLRLEIPGWSWATLAVALGAVALERGYLTLALVAVIGGASAAGVYLYLVTWVQATVAPALHGRVFALVEAASSLVAPLAYVGIGLLIDAAGPPRRHLLFAAAALLAAIWAGVLFVAAGGPPSDAPNSAEKLDQAR